MSVETMIDQRAQGKPFNDTVDTQILRAALNLVKEYWHKDRNETVIEEGMEILDELFGMYSLEHPKRYAALVDPSKPMPDSDLGYARYIGNPAEGKPAKDDVYRILAKVGNQTKINGTWYPAVTFQDVDTYSTYTRTAEEFETKFRVFDSYQDAFTWGGDF
jgi:hypothetical protein